MWNPRVGDSVAEARENLQGPITLFLATAPSEETESRAGAIP